MVEQWREDLIWIYLHDICRLPVYPWDTSDCINIQDIFTNLAILLDLPKPFQSLRVPLKSYEDIFTCKTQEGTLPSRILVQGEAGTGKSTLSAKLAFDWAQRKRDSPLGSVELLFLIRMRDLEINTDLEDAILSHLLPEDTTATSDHLKQYLRHHGQKCVVILDGYDESCYKGLKTSKVGNQGNIVNILSNNILRHCRVIVTSRPTRIAEFEEARKSYMNFVVTVFSEKDVNDYVEKFFGEENLLADRLLQVLASNSMKTTLASTPLVTQLICLYWKHMGGTEIPTSMSKLQSALFKFMMEHYSAKLTSEREVNLEELVIALGEIALSAIWPPESRLVFSKEEIATLISSEVLQDACSIGLLAVRQTAIGRSTKEAAGQDPLFFARKKRTVEFYHKSGQEKCAGDYLAHLAVTNSSVCTKYINSLKSVQDALTVRLVLLSASGASFRAAEVILKRLNQIYEDELLQYMQQYTKGELDIENSRKVQQFIELCLQCNIECEAAGRMNKYLLLLFPNGRLVFTGISAPTAIAMRYMLHYVDNADAISSVYVNGIPRKGKYVRYRLDWRTLSDNLYQKFLQAQGKLSHSELYDKLQECDIGDDLSEVQLHQVFETWEDETRSSVLALLDGLRYVNVKDLNLKNIYLGNESSKLFQVIKDGGLLTLTHLDLANTGLEDQHLAKMAEVISKLVNLKVLIVSNYQIDGALVLLADSLSNILLEIFIISWIRASASTMTHVCQKLPSFGTQLQQLWLEGNDMDDEGLKMLAVFLPQASDLLKLSFSTSGLTCMDTLAMCLQQIKYLSKLQYLRLYDVPLSSSHLLSLISAEITHWEDLRQLRLWPNNKAAEDEVTEDVSKHFVAALTQMPNLVEMTLFNVRLTNVWFQRMLDTCKDKSFEWLQYSRRCLPSGVDIKQYDFLCLV